jgi:hypothetical protein
MFKPTLRRALLPVALLAATALGGCYAYPAGYYGYGTYAGYYAPYGYGYPGYVGTGLVVGGWGYGYRPGFGYGYGAGWRGGWHGGWGYRGGFRGGVAPGGHGGVGSPGSWHH